jgi:hypothetical protein
MRNAKKKPRAAARASGPTWARSTDRPSGGPRRPRTPSSSRRCCYRRCATRSTQRRAAFATSASSIAPALERLRPSRRDSELARQTLLALRYLLPAGSSRQKQNLRGRDFYEDAMRLCEIVTDAEGLEPALAVQPGANLDDGAATTDAAAADIDASLDDGALPPELEGFESDSGRRRRRGRRGQGRERDGAPEGRTGPPPQRGPSLSSQGRTPGPLPPPIPVDLSGLLAATRSLSSSAARPAFLGSGAFGGPWSSRVE